MVTVNVSKKSDVKSKSIEISERACSKQTSLEGVTNIGQTKLNHRQTPLKISTSFI